MNKTISKILATAALGFFLTGNAMAAHIALPKVLASMPGAQNIKVLKKISLHKYNLIAWVTKANGRVSVMYTDPTGSKYMFLGLLIGPDGRNITKQLVEKYSPSPNYHKVYESIKGRQMIHDGDKGPLVYVFFDPNCIFCHKLWTDTRAAVKKGELQIDWIPVGFLKSSSTPKAVSIMKAKNPLKAMIRNEKGFNTATEEGAINPTNLSHPNQSDKKVLAEIHANEKTMKKNGFDGTPTVLFKGKNDGHYHVFKGVPPGGVKTLLNVAG